MEDTPKITIGQNVAILVDSSNIDISIAETFGKHTYFDYKESIPEILGGRSLNRFFLFKDNNYNISEKLIELIKIHYKGAAIKCKKSADIPLTIKAIQLSSKVDTIIIMSGDKDYIELVNQLRYDGVRVEFVSVRRTTSMELINHVDFWHEIKKDNTFYYKPQTNHYKSSNTANAQN